jgi:hypothetical protein
MIYPAPQHMADAQNRRKHRRVSGLQLVSQIGFQGEEKWILEYAHDHSRLQSYLYSHWLSSAVMRCKMMQQERPIVRAVPTGAL